MVDIWIFGVGIVGLVILLIWPHLRKEKADGDSRNYSLDILKQRYAKGEIGKEEYEEKKKDLT